MTVFESKLVSISVTLVYHSCQPYIAKLYWKTPLGFDYYCQRKTIFYNSSALIQMKAQICEVKKPIALVKEHSSYASYANRMCILGLTSENSSCRMRKSFT